jgi:REP element-mobilizing transposase RayT
MWNDTDIPLAYLITFRTYGTWLHGDERGSVDRFHNIYQEPYAEANSERKASIMSRMGSTPVILDAQQRNLVDAAVRKVCEYKRWALMALNVRTNHIHVVVAIGTVKSDTALNAFKAYATRNMRQNGCWKQAHSPWVNKGSKRSLWNEKSIEMAIDYVINGQGGELPKFD